MLIKLKKEALDLGGLSSSSSCQGFSTDTWKELNSGNTVTIDSIPLKCRELNKIEEVAIISSKSSSKKGVK